MNTGILLDQPAAFAQLHNMTNTGNPRSAVPFLLKSGHFERMSPLKVRALQYTAASVLPVVDDTILQRAVDIAESLNNSIPIEAIIKALSKGNNAPQAIAVECDMARGH